MDLQTVLTEVHSWSVGDRIRLLNELWDRLAEPGQEPELSDEQKAELDRRLAEDDAAPDDEIKRQQHSPGGIYAINAASTESYHDTIAATT